MPYLPAACGGRWEAERVAIPVRLIDMKDEAVMRLAVTIVMVGLLMGGCARHQEDKWTRSRPATYRVTGRVEMQGKPVDGAKVVFHTAVPVNGKDYSAFGYTDGGGAFTLQTFRDGDGAVAGEHWVTVEKITYSDPPPPKNEGDPLSPPVETSHLPARYRSGKTSGITATVEPNRRNSFTFTIEEK